MSFYPCFLSVVFILRNQANEIEDILSKATESISSVVADYELIVVDNASNDNSVAVLKQVTSIAGLANVQVYTLTKEVDSDTAAWVGLENALGDFVAVIDPVHDDVMFIQDMLKQAVSGADVVFATNTNKKNHNLLYRGAHGIFNSLFYRFNGVDLGKDAPTFRILSKRVINFILQHPQPHISYRHLPATGGFSKVRLTYSHSSDAPEHKRLWDSVDRGMQLLVSTTRAPMRLVTTLSMFGAAANLVYSIYVVAIAIFKSDVAPGWVSFSLQQSGMFFLLSLVLLVLGEYILHMARLSNEGPAYHVAQEFTSARMTRLDKLNIEVVEACDTQPESIDTRG